MKTFGYIVLGLIAFVFLIFFLNVLGFSVYSTFAPKIAEVQNQVYHNSQQFSF